MKTVVPFSWLNVVLVPSENNRAVVLKLSPISRPSVKSPTVFESAISDLKKLSELMLSKVSASVVYSPELKSSTVTKALVAVGRFVDAVVVCSY